MQALLCDWRLEPPAHAFTYPVFHFTSRLLVPTTTYTHIHTSPPPQSQDEIRHLVPFRHPPRCAPRALAGRSRFLWNLPIRLQWPRCRLLFRRGGNLWNGDSWCRSPSSADYLQLGPRVVHGRLRRCARCTHSVDHHLGKPVPCISRRECQRVEDSLLIHSEIIAQHVQFRSSKYYSFALLFFPSPSFPK